MDQQIMQQYALGLAAIAIGLSGWLLPFKWNLLRLRRSFATLVSEKVNMMIPKVVGTILILLGLVVVFGTITAGSFE